jgi:predicted transglutaminase-like cysteine proteinase
MTPYFSGGQAQNLCAHPSFQNQFSKLAALAIIIFNIACSPSSAANINASPALTNSASSEEFDTKHRSLGARPKFFNSLIFKANSSHSSSPFITVTKTIKNEMDIYKKCEDSLPSCPSHLRKWGKLFGELKKLSGFAQIAKLNAALNAIVAYKTDLRAFGREDYWATPAQMLKSGGDCEEFALLKYVTLLELGYREDALRLVIVQDTKRKAGHAILTVALQGKVFALDSLTDAPARPHQVAHYRPVYSVSANQRWIHVSVKKRIQRKVAASK